MLFQALAKSGYIGKPFEATGKDFNHFVLAANQLEVEAFGHNAEIKKRALERKKRRRESTDAIHESPSWLVFCEVVDKQVALWTAQKSLLGKLDNAVLRRKGDLERFPFFLTLCWEMFCDSVLPLAKAVLIAYWETGLHNAEITVDALASGDAWRQLQTPERILTGLGYDRIVAVPSPLLHKTFLVIVWICHLLIVGIAKMGELVAEAGKLVQQVPEVPKFLRNFGVSKDEIRILDTPVDITSLDKFGRTFESLSLDRALETLRKDDKLSLLTHQMEDGRLFREYLRDVAGRGVNKLEKPKSKSVKRNSTDIISKEDEFTEREEALIGLDRTITRVFEKLVRMRQEFWMVEGDHHNDGSEVVENRNDNEQVVKILKNSEEEKVPGIANNSDCNDFSVQETMLQLGRMSVNEVSDKEEDGRRKSLSLVTRMKNLSLQDDKHNHSSPSDLPTPATAATITSPADVPMSPLKRESKYNIGTGKQAQNAANLFTLADDPICH